MFCFAVASRSKGLLIALPLNSLSSDLLLDANLTDDEGLIGPSREFEADLVEEPEEGPPMKVGIETKFLVVDVSDTALQSMREYDPVTDMHEDIKSFSDERPFDLPALGDILTEVAQWISSVSTGRLHFYSAREEQPTASVAPKKTQKRITNNQIAVQLAALAAQVHAFYPTGADEEAPSHGSRGWIPTCRSCCRSLTWNPCYPKNSVLVVDPGCKRTFSRSEGYFPCRTTSEGSCTDPQVRCHRCGSSRRVRYARSTDGSRRDANDCVRHIPTEFGHNAFGVASHLRRRNCRSADGSLSRGFHEYQGRRKARENAERFGQQDQQLLSPSRATALQENVPGQRATALSFLKEVELLSTKKGEIKPKGQPNPKSSPEAPESPSPKRRPKFPKKPAASPQGS